MGRLTGRYYDVTNDIWHWSIKSNSTNDGLVATPQDILDKLAYYEDLEEQGLLIKLDLNQYKRDDLDRCTHRHCNNCDKYRRELQKYKDLEEQGRLIEVEYATIVGEAGNCSKCGESYMDVADADADQSRYIPNFCPWCGAIFVSEAKLKELKGVKE